MSDFAIKTLMSDRVSLPWKFASNASQTQANVQTFLKQKYEGRCVQHGYVQADSLMVQSLSMASLRGTDVLIDVNLSVNILLPAKGDILEHCVVDTISAAGVSCSYVDPDKNTPYSFLQVFVSRDQMLASPDEALRKKFIELDLHSESKPVLRVTVQRCNFALGDRLISVLATIEQADDIEYTTDPQALPSIVNIYTPKLKKPKYLKQTRMTADTVPLQFERQAITSKIQLPTQPKPSKTSQQ